MRNDIFYKWREGGGFLIRYREKFFDYELLEVPIFGGEAQHIGFFLSIGSAKEHADTLC